jgi:hypothetical protein
MGANVLFVSAIPFLPWPPNISLVIPSLLSCLVLLGQRYSLFIQFGMSYSHLFQNASLPYTNLASILSLEQASTIFVFILSIIILGDRPSHLKCYSVIVGIPWKREEGKGGTGEGGDGEKRRELDDRTTVTKPLVLIFFQVCLGGVLIIAFSDVSKIKGGKNAILGMNKLKWKEGGGRREEGGGRRKEEGGGRREGRAE